MLQLSQTCDDKFNHRIIHLFHMVFAFNFHISPSKIIVKFCNSERFGSCYSFTSRGPVSHYSVANYTGSQHVGENNLKQMPSVVLN